MNKTKSLTWLWLMLIGSFLLGAVSWAQAADLPEIQPLRKWSGRMERDLRWAYPARGFLINQEELDRLWADWRIAGEKPRVDFATQMVLVRTCTCSHITLHPRLDPQGDLTIGVTITKDLTQDAGYVIFLIPRQGVRTVEGKPLEAYR
jgi:hypothetical protein